MSAGTARPFEFGNPAHIRAVAIEEAEHLKEAAALRLLIAQALADLENGREEQADANIEEVYKSKILPAEIRYLLTSRVTNGIFRPEALKTALELNW